MTKPINTDSIEKATDKSWTNWVKELDNLGARDLSHLDLARLVNGRLENGVDNPSWWAQSITVAYEQHVGKRVPGHLANGLFELAVSKPLAIPRDELFQKTVRWFEKQNKLNGFVPLKPRSSETPKRSTWRCDFTDGSRFSATVEGDGDRSKLILSQTAVSTKQEADDWKEFWRSTTDQLIQA